MRFHLPEPQLSPPFSVSKYTNMLVFPELLVLLPFLRPSLAQLNPFPPARSNITTVTSKTHPDVSLSYKKVIFYPLQNFATTLISSDKRLRDDAQCSWLCWLHSPPSKSRRHSSIPEQLLLLVLRVPRQSLHRPLHHLARWWTRL